MADRTVLLVPRRRQVLTLLGLVAAAALVVLAGTAVANGFPGGGPQTSQYRTALVASGTVSQTLSLSGTAARVGQVTVGWPMSGTVATVDVSVGQQVSQGQQLATMDPAPLQQAVLDAQAQVDQAQVTLDNDQSAASSQSSATSSATTRSSAGSSSGSGGAAASTGSARTGNSSSRAGGAPIDTKGLTAATGKVDQAQQAAASACAPLLATASATGKPVASTSSNASTTSPTSTATHEPSATSDSTTSEPSSSSTSSPSSSSSTTTSPSATAPAAEQVTACLAALQAVSSAQAQAGSTIDSLAAQLAKAAAAAKSAGTSAGSGSASSGAAGSGSAGGQAAGSASARSSGSAGGESSGTGAATSSEAKLILDQAALTSAQATLTKADDELAAAPLNAPVAGVVGSVSLVAGSSTAANTGIVLVTPSAATVTVQVPQANLAALAVGQAATVTPAGDGSLSGSVSSISLLPTSSTTGSSATTYAVVVDVPQATDALATGAKASVTIETRRVDNVLTVPVSAVTSVATGTGSVGVLRDGAVSQTTVRTGSVGQGKVQVLSGLTAGQTVVLADTSQALPSNNSGFGARVGGGAGGITGGGGGGFAGPGGAPPAAGPGR